MMRSERKPNKEKCQKEKATDFGEKYFCSLFDRKQEEKCCFNSLADEQIGPNENRMLVNKVGPMAQIKMLGSTIGPMAQFGPSESRMDKATSI